MAIGLTIIEMSEEILLQYIRGKYIREADYVPPKPSRHYVDHAWTTTRDLPSGRLRLVAYSPYWSVDWSADWQETQKASLRSAIKSIVKSVEDAAVDLVAKLEEAGRKAEIARQEWLAADEKRRREQDRRCVSSQSRAARSTSAKSFSSGQA